MIVLVLGFVFIILGVLAMRYPELVSSLKKEDENQWILLGSPPPYAFHKTIGVYSWLQGRGYESSESATIQVLGEKARKKAVFTRYSLIIGVTCIALGFVLSLTGI